MKRPGEIVAPDVGALLLETMRVGVAQANDARPDFLEWIEEHGWLIDPHADPDKAIIPFKLWPDQEDLSRFLIAGYDRGEDRTCNKSRKVGATWVAMHAIEYLFEHVYRFSALLISRKDELVDDGTHESLFGKIRFIQSMQPSDARPHVQDNTKRLKNLTNNALIKGETTNISVGRSQRFGVVVTDEWAFVDAAKQKKIKLSLESVGRSWWRISTPNKKGDDFHQSCRLGKKRESKLDQEAAAQGLTRSIEERKYLEIGWPADPRRDEDWYEKLLETLTWDEREREYNLSFRGVSGTRIWHVPKADRITYVDADLPANARRDWMWVAMLDFGSGPSWTVFLLALLDLRDPKRPEWWLEKELIFERKAAPEIATRIKQVMKQYSSKLWIGGDPAGKAVDSMQESWTKNLRKFGVPVRELPPKFNSGDLIDMTIVEFQRMVDQDSAHVEGKGRFHVHEDCAITLDAVDSWEYAVPDGVDPHTVDKTVFGPKKDCWSHPGDCLRMIVGATLRLQLGRQQQLLRRLGAKRPSAPAEMSAMFDRVLQRQMKRSLLGDDDE